MPAPGTISVERERALIAIAQATLGSYPDDPLGLTARNEVVEANMPLAIAISKKAPYFKMTHDEVKSAGYYGLIMAVLRFDLSRVSAATGLPIAFTTYAYWIIRAVISREIFVRDKWFGARLGMRVNSSGIYGVNFTGEDWDFDSWSTWEPCLAGTADEPVLNEEYVAVILAAWDESPFLARLATILRVRYGIGACGTPGGEPGTLADCGLALGGLTKERARQLESKAVERFRLDYDQLEARGRVAALPPEHFVNGKAWSA